MLIDMADLQLGLSVLDLALDEIFLSVVPNGPGGLACYVCWPATRAEVLSFMVSDYTDCLDIDLPCDGIEGWIGMDEVSIETIEDLDEDALIDVRYVLCTGKI